MTPQPIVLLVDDDDAIRETVSECLCAEGYDVRAFAHGAEALEWLGRGERPSVVVLDLVMPVMNGAELLARLRATPALRDLPVVLMTAAIPTPGHPAPAADTILTKPFELDQLLDAVARHVGLAA
ncbi:MAG TPA: response regulator [Anaeromyxobacter sp.]